MKVEPTTGSPPIPTIVELPMPSCGELVADLVGQRPRARDEPDRALARRARAGMIPTFALPGESTPGQFGPISVAPRARA